jgi:hypothetical protein
VRYAINTKNAIAFVKSGKEKNSIKIEHNDDLTVHFVLPNFFNGGESGKKEKTI